MNNMPQNPSDVFSTLEPKAADVIEPLVNEPYSYDNIIENPIIKPIAETDRSIRDIDEMINKKLTDCKRDKGWINQAMVDVPAYSDSQFVAKLIKFAQDTQDIIKLQDLNAKNYRSCIKEMVDITRERYGVRVSKEDNSFYEPHTITPSGGPFAYLVKMVGHPTITISECAKKVMDLYEKDLVNTDEKTKFVYACNTAYKAEEDKDKKNIIGKIVRMEI